MAADPPTPPAALRSVTGFLSRPPHATLLAVCVLGFDLVLQVAGRYVALSLLRLGAGPLLVGAFGTLAMLVAAATPYVESPMADASDRVAVAVCGTASALGFYLWITAPALAATAPLGLGVPAWAWLFAGLVALHAWKLRGAGATFAAVTARAPYEPLVTGAAGAERLRRAALVAGVVPLAVLFGVAPFVPAFHVVLALGAALGVTATVAQVLLGPDVDTAPALPFPDADRVARDVRGLPRRLRGVFVGDALVHAAVGSVYVFLVVVAVDVVGVTLTVAGLRVPGASAFAALVAVEAAVALCTVLPGEELVREFGPHPVLVAGLAAAAAFPALLVATRGFEAAALAFAVFGARFLAQQARGDLLADAGPDRVARSYRAARALVVVPSALVGGVLFAVSPVLHFLAASAAGTLGVLVAARPELLDHPLAPEGWP